MSEHTFVHIMVLVVTHHELRKALNAAREVSPYNSVAIDPYVPICNFRDGVVAFRGNVQCARFMSFSAGFVIPSTNLIMARLPSRRVSRQLNQSCVLRCFYSEDWMAFL